MKYIKNLYFVCDTFFVALVLFESEKKHSDDFKIVGMSIEAAVIKCNLIYLENILVASSKIVKISVFCQFKYLTKGLDLLDLLAFCGNGLDKKKKCFLSVWS